MRIKPICLFSASKLDCLTFPKMHLCSELNNPISQLFLPVTFASLIFENNVYYPRK